MRALVCFLLGVHTLARGGERLSPPAWHTGMCDASGAVAVSSNLFVVADDEDNRLRLYRADRGGASIKQFDCSSFLQLAGSSAEADLEGAARLGDRAFWIGSHGRNQKGKQRPSRCCLFATDFRMTGGELTLTPVGKPYRRLLVDLANDSRFKPFHLAEAARRAPKEAGGLSIEGLSATPEGHLLIGFRNPVPNGKALLIPLTNPSEVVEGKPARLDPAIQLDLGGLGIRDIACHDGTYIITAGSWRGGGHFRLFTWSGPGAKARLLQVARLRDCQPEALVIYPQHGLQRFQILSDDGGVLIDGCPCKDLKNPNRRSFRSYWVTP